MGLKCKWCGFDYGSSQRSFQKHVESAHPELNDPEIVEAVGQSREEPEDTDDENTPADDEKELDLGDRELTPEDIRDMAEAAEDRGE